MIKTILVHLLGDGQDEFALKAAYELARPFGAHIEALHLRRGLGAAAWRAPPDAVLGAALTGGLAEQLGEVDETHARSARTAFDDLCSRENLMLADTPGPDAVSAEWSDLRGGLDRLLDRARFNDMLLTRRSPGAPDGADEDIGRLIMECSRPVLVVPDGGGPVSLLGTIAVAWKDTDESARALSAALPMLQKANRVVLLCAADQSEAAPDASDALRLLAWHGIGAEARSVLLEVGQSPARAVLDAAVGAGAGLLVLGGYGHPRVLEWMLGGFTQDVLDDARISVLIVH
jgi:nucleotide-binding universal stress UspA family protein